MIQSESYELSHLYKAQYMITRILLLAVHIIYQVLTDHFIKITSPNLELIRRIQKNKCFLSRYAQMRKHMLT